MDALKSNKAEIDRPFPDSCTINDQQAYDEDYADEAHEDERFVLQAVKIRKTCNARTTFLSGYPHPRHVLRPKVTRAAHYS